MKARKTAKSGRLYLISVLILILSVFTSVIFAPTAEGCTTFVAHGKATATGGMLLAKTRDRPRMSCGYLLKEPKSKNSHRFIGAALSFQPDTISYGCNEKGVCYVLTWIETWDKDPKGIDTMILGGRMLEKVSMAVEGIKFMKQAVDTYGSCPKGWDGTSMMIGDLNGFYVIEISGHHYQSAGPFKDTWYVHTNQYILPEMIQYGFQAQEHSLSRQERAEVLMRKYEGKIDIPILIKCLRDFQHPKYPISNQGTIQAAVLSPAAENTELFTVMWSCLGESRVSGFVPLYLGMNEIPKEFKSDTGDWDVFEGLRNEIIASPTEKEPEVARYVQEKYFDFENAVISQIDDAKRKVNAAVKNGNIKAARDILTAFSAKNSTAVIKIACEFISDPDFKRLISEDMWEEGERPLIMN